MIIHKLNFVYSVLMEDILIYKTWTNKVKTKVLVLFLFK